MSSLARIIGEIQSCLATGNITRTPQVEDLARSYSTECHRILDRLKRSDEFLSRGLLTEAIQNSRTQPDLLDELSLLEFAEKDAWEEILDLYQLPIPPKLQVHKAISINRAYSEIQALEEPLAKWRKLNIGMAPLRRRIDVIRRLYRNDPNNIAFKDNLAELEAERVVGMLAEAREASRRQDPFSLRSILVELEDETNWVEPPDPDHAAEIRQICGKAMENAARKEAQASLRELLEGFRYKDEKRCRLALNEFQNRCAEAAVTSSDDMMQVAQPVRKWLEDLDLSVEKRAKRDQIAQLIWASVQNPEATEEELLRHRDVYDKNKNRYGAMDPGLRQALNARLDKFRRSEQARESMIIGAAVILGTILIVSFLVFVIARSR